MPARSFDSPAAAALAIVGVSAPVGPATRPPLCRRAGLPGTLDHCRPTGTGDVGRRPPCCLVPPERQSQHEIAARWRPWPLAPRQCRLLPLGGNGCLAQHAYEQQGVSRRESTGRERLERRVDRRSRTVVPSVVPAARDGSPIGTGVRDHDEKPLDAPIRELRAPACRRRAWTSTTPRLELDAAAPIDPDRSSVRSHARRSRGSPIGTSRSHGQARSTTG